jgi:flagellar biosynthesis protein FlhF
LVFGAKRLLFTRLDETETYGPILNEAVRTGLPISFLATGQQVPEDLEAATKARIIELLLGRQTAQEAAAAG